MGRPTLAVLFLATLLGAPTQRAEASWTENEITILSLDEVRVRLDGVSLDGSLSGSTPILIPPGWDATHPADLRAVLSLSGVALRRDTDRETLFAPLALIDEAAAAARRRPFAAVPPPLDGPGVVARGAVILHGEFLEPPFQFEVDDAGILVNGVRVFPVPGPNVPPPAPTSEQERSHAAREAAFEVYQQRMAAGDAVTARSELRSRALEIPGVISARWDGDRALILERDNGRQEVLYVGDDLRTPDPPSDEERRASFEDQAASMRRTLLNDRTLLLGATYTLAILEPDAPAFRRRLTAILASSEPRTLKLARIQAYTAHRESATDILLAETGGE